MFFFSVFFSSPPSDSNLSSFSNRAYRARTENGPIVGANLFVNKKKNKNVYYFRKEKKKKKNPIHTSNGSKGNWLSKEMFINELKESDPKQTHE